MTTSHIEFTWSHQTGGCPDASAMLQGKTSPVGHTKGARVSEVQLVNHSPGYAEPGPSTSTGKLLHAVNVHLILMQCRMRIAIYMYIPWMLLEEFVWRLVIPPPIPYPALIPFLSLTPY